MYTSVKLICLSTLLIAAPVLPQKIDRAAAGEHEFNDSQPQLLAKTKDSKKDRCTSSPTPGCSRRDNSSHQSQQFAVA